MTDQSSEETERLSVTDVLNLAFIAFVLFVGEGLRFIGCKVFGKPYRSPQMRIAREVADD